MMLFKVTTTFLLILSIAILFVPRVVHGGPCTAACDGGTKSMEAFCRGLAATAQIKALCWAACYGSNAACKGFCYARGWN
ncbi:unnamed protein product [Adineta ricciae]|uniref:Uncharacterized protein n=1 Tax=Adineta ricciae TaxID=249248 RepID=A0A814ZSD8_ADIRI|nr:unnamed protein product [Adineta ricciae]